MSSVLSSESELTSSFLFFPVVAFREPFEDCPLAFFDGAFFDRAFFVVAWGPFLEIDLAMKEYGNVANFWFTNRVYLCYICLIAVPINTIFITSTTSNGK